MSYVTYDWKVDYTTPTTAGTRTMVVNAQYAAEAEELVEGMVPGCTVTGHSQGRKYSDGEAVGNSSGGGSFSDGDGEGTLAAIGILGTIALVMWAWPVIKWLLIIGAVGGAAYGIIKVAEMIKD